MRKKTMGRNIAPVVEDVTMGRRTRNSYGYAPVSALEDALAISGKCKLAPH